MGNKKPEDDIVVTPSDASPEDITVETPQEKVVQLREIEKKAVFGPITFDEKYAYVTDVQGTTYKLPKEQYAELLARDRSEG